MRQINGASKNVFVRFLFGFHATFFFFRVLLSRPSFLGLRAVGISPRMWVTLIIYEETGVRPRRSKGKKKVARGKKGRLRSLEKAEEGRRPKITKIETPGFDPSRELFSDRQGHDLFSRVWLNLWPRDRRVYTHLRRTFYVMPVVVTALKSCFTRLRRIGHKLPRGKQERRKKKGAFSLACGPQ